MLVLIWKVSCHHTDGYICSCLIDDISYFVRSGMIQLHAANDLTLPYLNASFAWSNTSDYFLAAVGMGWARAYYFQSIYQFEPENDAGYSSNRYYGFPLRCLSTE